MSDILIRGFDLPHHGYREVRIQPDGCITEVNECGLDEYVGTAEYLPYHGRLVDALYIRDGIIQKWMDKAGDSHMYKCGMEDAYEVIRNAPTIIPASEEVYAIGYDTAGNYRWTGTRTGEHIVPTENGEV